jgi:hypothetical protein
MQFLNGCLILLSQRVLLCVTASNNILPRFRIARAILLNDDEAEDVMQEARSSPKADFCPEASARPVTSLRVNDFETLRSEV